MDQRWVELIEEIQRQGFVEVILRRPAARASERGAGVPATLPAEGKGTEEKAR